MPVPLFVMGKSDKNKSGKEKAKDRPKKTKKTEKKDKTKKKKQSSSVSSSSSSSDDAETTLCHTVAASFGLTLILRFDCCSLK